jgi:hypothetical protein
MPGACFQYGNKQNEIFEMSSDDLVSIFQEGAWYGDMGR